MNKLKNKKDYLRILKRYLSIGKANLDKIAFTTRAKIDFVDILIVIFLFDIIILLVLLILYNKFG
jgi:hypothetical protein